MPARPEADPVGVGGLLEVHDLEPKVASEVEGALLLHDAACLGRAARLGEDDAAGAALVELGDELRQRVVVRRAGRVVGGVEVRLEDHPLSCDVTQVEQLQHVGHAAAAIGRVGQGHPCPPGAEDPGDAVGAERRQQRQAGGDRPNELAAAQL